MDIFSIICVLLFYAPFIYLLYLIFTTKTPRAINQTEEMKKFRRFLEAVTKKN